MHLQSCWLYFFISQQGVLTVLNIVAYHRSFPPGIEPRNERRSHSICGGRDFPSLPRLEELGERLVSNEFLEFQLGIVVDLEADWPEDLADGIDVSRDVVEISIMNCCRALLYVSMLQRSMFK